MTGRMAKSVMIGAFEPGEFHVFKIIASLILGLAGAVGAVAQVTCNSFELNAGLTAETVSITLATDLPDATRISIEVSRRYWRKGQQGVFSVEYLAKELSVGELKSGLKVDVSQKALDTVMAKISAAAEHAGRGPVVIAELDQRFKVRALTTQHQPDRSFGDYNSKLSGSAVIQDNEFRGARLLKWLEIGGGNEDEKRRNEPKPVMVKARDFEAGKLYVLRRKVDLMRRLKAPDTEPTVMAPEAAIIYVDRRLEDGDWVWFRVAVTKAPDQGPCAFGWARHDAFDLKKHRETSATVFLEKLEASGYMSDGFERPRFRILPKLELTDWPNGVSLAGGTIEVDDGLERAELELQARMAAWDLFERSQADGVVLKLRRAGDTEPRAGEAWILPSSVELPEAMGRSDPEKFGTGDLKTRVRIDPSYFKERPKALAVDSQVILKEEGSFEVVLWKDALGIGKEQAARIAGGSTGRILALRYIEIGDRVVLRYQVEAENGKVGWVAAEVLRAF